MKQKINIFLTTLLAVFLLFGCTNFESTNSSVIENKSDNKSLNSDEKLKNESSTVSADENDSAVEEIRQAPEQEDNGEDANKEEG